MSKISGDFSPCKHLTVKKVSVDSAGSVVLDADVNDVYQGVSLTVRCASVGGVSVSSAKRVGESGFEKGAVGAKVCSDRFALECAVDACGGRASCSAVVRVGGGSLVGARVQSAVGAEATVGAECGVSFRGEGYEVCGVWSGAAKKGTVGAWMEAGTKTRVGAVWEVESWKTMPRGAVGVVRRMGEDTEIRGKVNERGVVSGALKTTVDKKLSLSASVEVDAAHLEGGNHKLGLGLEFIF